MFHTIINNFPIIISHVQVLNLMIKPILSIPITPFLLPVTPFLNIH